jgi:hypothetical protein
MGRFVKGQHAVATVRGVVVGASRKTVTIRLREDDGRAVDLTVRRTSALAWDGASALSVSLTVPAADPGDPAHVR